MKFPQESVRLFSSPDVIVSQDQLKILSLAACLACGCTIHSSAGSLSFSQDLKCLFLSSGGQHCFLIPCRNTAGLQQSLFFQKKKRENYHIHIFFSGDQRKVEPGGWTRTQRLTLYYCFFNLICFGNPVHC